MYMRFVICGKDCNKHESKIFACFDSIEKCVDYLDRKGEEIFDLPFFDITEYKISDKEQEGSMFNITFQHKKLFNALYAMCGNGAICTHKGEIHIGCITNEDDFSDIYEWLSETYV